MGINPGFRLITLADGSVCLGTGPGGLWIRGLDARQLAFVEDMSAGRPPRPDLPDGERERLLRALEPALVEDPGPGRGAGGARGDRLAPDVAQWSAAYASHAGGPVGLRPRRTVRIAGLDRCGLQVADLLAAAGIGSLELHAAGTVGAGDLGTGPLRGPDLGHPLLGAALSRLASRHPYTRFSAWDPAGRPGAGTTPDAVVAVAHGWLPPAWSAHLAGTAAPHLRVLVGDSGADVGPFVVPGATACLDCLPGTALPAAPADPERTPEPRVETALAAAVAGIAALQVLMLVDGVNVPATVGGVLALDLATGGTARRSVEPRPGCSCRAVRAA